MKKFLILCCALSPCLTAARLQLAPDEPLAVFAGNDRAVPVVFQNPSHHMLEADLRVRLLQASSSTAAPLGERPWKTLQVLPGQTVLERARLDFPFVKVETRFLLQWLSGDHHVIGTTEVMIYPTGLLAELKSLVGKTPLGLFDPDDQLKPLLRKIHIEFEDLQRAPLEDFTGLLAIFGPFGSRDQIPPGLPGRLAARSKTGLAALWIEPPDRNQSTLRPSFYPVPFDPGAVIVAEARLVRNLAENPLAQMNLIRLAALAITPPEFGLPGLDPEITP